jgi:DNA-directed RNA polymerase specialized sigma24 family protein
VLEDKYLVWRFKRGSPDALRRIYGKYRDDLLRIACSLLGTTGDAEDVVQDTFLYFVKSQERFQLTGNLRSGAE